MNDDDLLGYLPERQFVFRPLTAIELMADFNKRAELAGIPLWTLEECEEILRKYPVYHTILQPKRNNDDDNNSENPPSAAAS